MTFAHTRERLVLNTNFWFPVECVNSITVISSSYLTVHGDIVMYDVRGMIGTEWKARSKFDRCGIPYQRYTYGGEYIYHRSRCSFGCKLSVTRHACREIGFAYTGETSRRGINAKLKGIELFDILALFPSGYGYFSKLK